MEYNETQKKAITHKEGPFMVLAAPGSGKTMVIIQHTKYLIEQLGVEPSAILVVTFTKAAAREMKQRFESLMDTQAVGVTFGTFHAVFFQILKHAYHYTAANIIREERKRQYIKELVEREEMDLSDEADYIGEIISEISYVKGEMLNLSAYYSTNCSEDVFRRIYNGYVERCRKANLIDFDDMQGYCWQLLKERPDILAMWQKHFQYILIDEFQDINRIQYEIIRMLAKPQDNLFIVGDDDQSIYHFRGAKPELMLHFTKDYPNAGQVLLGINYRSSEDVVEASKQLIANNQNRYEKEIQAAQGKVEPIHIVRRETQKEENLDIVEKIQKLNREGICYSEMAVLFRTNQQPRLLTERLMEYNIPFRMKDGIFNLYDHWISQNIMAYINLALGDMSRSNFLTIMNRPKRYISRDLLDEVTVDFEHLKMKVANRDWMVERLENFAGQVSMLSKMTPYAAVNFIRKGIGYDSFIEEYCQERQIKSEEFMDILHELQESAREYDTYQQWFSHIEKYGEQLKEVQREDNCQDAVLLATMHGSKGLEFEAVFIIDACEGITPHKKAVKDSELEEERRMFYVAMTRARKYLYIYVVKHIFNKVMQPSRYIGELEFDRRRLAIGVRVFHQKFGEGTITYLDEKRIGILFEALQDTKIFHIDYAIGNGYIQLMD